MTLYELFVLLRKHLALVIILPIACAVVAGGYMLMDHEESYSATTSIYVQAPEDDSPESTLNTNLSASNMIANDAVRLATSGLVADAVADQLGLEDGLDEYNLDVSLVSGTRIISITVSGPTAEGVVDVANAVAATTGEYSVELMNAGGIVVLDEALEEAASTSGRTVLLYTLVGLVAGLFVAVAIVVLMDMLNPRVRNTSEIEQLTEAPIIGSIQTSI